jgi:molybdopterin-containing oxidoreductase family membrane subunit
MENRVLTATEAMTNFAVILVQTGSYLAYGPCLAGIFVLPYPNTRGPLSVNFNSPLLWDVFAISTYFTVSLLFLV